MSVHTSSSSTRSSLWHLIGALVLFAAELGVIGVLFKHGIEFTCLENWPFYACRGPSSILVSIYCVCAALALFAFLYPRPFAELFARAGHVLWPLGLNLIGVLLALTPTTFLAEGSGTSSLWPALFFWCLGMATILSGLALYLAPVGRWMIFARDQIGRLLPLVIGSALAPVLATLIRPLWQLDTIADATFFVVTRLIERFGYDVTVYPESRIIGAGDFYIDIAPVCSGIEGIALVTIFVTLYLFLFKSELRFPRVLILYPVGIAISASLNIVRIVALLAMGLSGNPELAVGGFHSHAGWLMFTLVAMAIIVAANSVGWLRKSSSTETLHQPAADIPPFLQDTTVAMILPFAIFMFSAMLAQAFSASPGMIYPARAVLMAGALALFVPLYYQFDWRLDRIAIGVGAFIGLMWVLIPVTEPEGPPPYGALTGGLLILWFVARGVGTIILVPVIEELFFRGYLEQKLKRSNTLIWSLAAAVIVAVLFALLHGRWAEAFAASLAFSYVRHRSGRVSDAIIAHGTANAIVFVAAVVTGQIHII